MKRSTPSGYICPCGTSHPFGVWVFAHWTVNIVHRCSKCRRLNELLRGRVINPPRKYGTSKGKGAA